MQFDYLNRNIESEIINLSGKYKVLLVTGPRQVGKTTLLKYLSEKNRSGRIYSGR